MPFLRPGEETKVREWFVEPARPVELLVALGPEETPRAGSGDLDLGAEMVGGCEGLAELGDRTTCRVEQEPVGFPPFPAVFGTGPTWACAPTGCASAGGAADRRRRRPALGPGGVRAGAPPPDPLRGLSSFTGGGGKSVPGRGAARPA